MKKEFETYDFSTAVLTRAKNITLDQLLDCPFTQPWAMSMICNSAHYSQYFELQTLADEMLNFQLNRLMRSIPTNERNQLFKMCNEMLQSRRSAGKP